MMEDKSSPRPVRLCSPWPLADKLHFGFDAYADTLSALIANKENASPLVMGVYGSWGAGKTTLMKAIKSRLDSDAFIDRGNFRRCKTVWFQAWKHAEEQEVLAAIIETVFKAMAADGFFSLARTRIKTVIRRFDKSRIFTSLSKLADGMDISEFFSEMDYKKELGAFETFQKFFDDMVWTFLNWRFKLSGKEKPDDKMGAMVIFIDDLDRCHPKGIVRVLETLKLYLNRSGCIFVIGADAEHLRRSLTDRYNEDDADRLLEKIIRIAFVLPQIPAEEFGLFLKDANMDKDNVTSLNEFLPLIVPKLHHNPRQFKRFINSLNLLEGLLYSTGDRIEFGRIMAWSMIGCLFSDLAAAIRENPETLIALRDSIGRLSDRFPETLPWELSRAQMEEENVPEPIQAFILERHLSRIVKDLEVTPEQINHLSTLSDAVLAPGYP